MIWASDQVGRVLVVTPKQREPVPIRLEGRNGVRCKCCASNARSRLKTVRVVVPSCRKQHKGVLIQVLVASFFVQLFGVCSTRCLDSAIR